MDDVAVFLFKFFVMLLLTEFSLSHPLCSNLRSPFTPKTPLAFCCQYNGSVCCNSTDDVQLQNQFEAMNISDPGCASVMKSIICSKCDQFSSELYRIESVPQAVPALCNSSTPANSTHSQPATTSFCSKVWDECKNVTISNSPFAPRDEFGVPNNSVSKPIDFWQSEISFCDEFGGGSDAGSVCFDGGPVSLNHSESPSLPTGICLEKIGNESYINMVGHPDGSDRVFLSNQAGKIWLVTVPTVGSGELLKFDESNPFLDLTDEVHFDSQLGLMGIAFHPNFVRNGRFFASFNCDKVKLPQCSGRCSCNSDVGCDPSKLSPDNGAQPCQYQSVIAEFTANDSMSQPSLVTRAQPLEVRRIFTMGLPFTTHHGGQILFGPEDGYLYFMMGDGGSSGDPYNFSQNKKSLLGKILRLDIDDIPSAKTISELGLWGKYSVPHDNPYSEDRELQPEIWALGFSNPWRCSFDSERPTYFMCADVGQDAYEEVDIVTKGGNYGWHIYEGPLIHNPPNSTGSNTSSGSSIDPIFPVMGYNHSNGKNAQGSASIIGGYFYRSTTDPCLYGRYLYSDLYANTIWAGTENPENSGNFTSSEIHMTCALDSPIQCDVVGANSAPSLGFVFSFGQDNRKDIYILASSGVYRIVRPSRCNYTCSKESVTTSTPPSSVPSSPIGKSEASINDLPVLHFFIVVFARFALYYIALV